MITGIKKAHCFSVYQHVDIASPVSSLSGSIDPFAVFPVISEGIIRAINGMLTCWLRPHILKEIREIVPSFANSNTPSSIKWKLFHVGIFATVKHGSPASILSGITASRDSSCMPMNQKPFLRLLHSQASTTTRLPALQASPKNDNGAPAGTRAQPALPFPWSFFFHSNNGKPAKCRANSVYCSTHNENVSNSRSIVNCGIKKPR